MAFRTSDNTNQRRLWWAAVFSILGLLVFHAEAKVYVLVLWSIYNVCLGVSSLGWMLFHPRALGRSSDTALAWSRWLTFAAATEIFLFALPNSDRSNATPGFVFLLVLAAVPFLFVCLLMLSLFGASLGAFARRNRSTCEEASIAAVSGWWISVTFAILLIFIVDRFRHSDMLLPFTFAGLPTSTLCVAWIVRRAVRHRNGRPVRIINSILKALVIRTSVGGVPKTFDLRGVSIGLLTGIVTAVVGQGITQPVQQSALMSLFRFRAQLLGVMSSQHKPLTRVVLEKMDAVSRASSVTNSSEAGVQAKMIRRLGTANVALIVLPAPTIDVLTAETGETNEAGIEKTVRDIPELARVVRANGHVLVVATPQQRASKRLQPLFAAAAMVVSFGVDRYGPAQIPTVPIRWDRDPPAPLEVYAALHQRALTISTVSGDTDYAMIAERRVPLAIAGRVVFDFRSAPGVELHRNPIAAFPYTMLMDNETISLAEFNQGSIAEPVDQFLAHKAVVLEPLVQVDVETSVGAMNQYEMLAQVTSALVNDSALQRSSRNQAMLWIVLIGVLIGITCAGKDPLQASWRVALLMLMDILYCLFSYLVLDVWSDPVLPLVTAAVSFLLVTQLTFTQERDERERNRKLFSRFVAPEFVDELLSSTNMKLALGGEKRNVCVLFADVRNFTGFAESHRPEEVIEVMNIYLTALTDALDDYGGLLDKYTGDGLMAFFEIKGDLRSELVRSVSAGLAMRDAALLVSRQLDVEGRRTLDVGIGMHYGEAIVGLVGNAERQINYTALGITVVVSARLQSLAEGGEVVVSEVIHDVVYDQFEFVPMDPVFVKGISTEMRPYQVQKSKSQAGEYV